MKTLQNNFTTPEQSKRLLELGLPADSADMWYIGSLDKRGVKYGSFPVFPNSVDYQIFDRDIPCWSVGRLIEIYVNLSSHEYVSLIFKKTFTPMDKILDKFEKDVKNGLLDFSKLEE